jgi:hypothetical protein
MPKRAGKLTCCATDAESSRGVFLPKQACLFNLKKVDIPARDALVHCRKCGKCTCKQCIRQLRVRAVKEVKRCSWWQLMELPVLNWLLRATPAKLFDVSCSNNVLAASPPGRTAVYFKDECMFCFDAVLPLRVALLSRVPKSMGYPVVQPSRGFKRLVFLTVSGAVRSDLQ